MKNQSLERFKKQNKRFLIYEKAFNGSFKPITVAVLFEKLDGEMDDKVKIEITCAGSPLTMTFENGGWGIDKNYRIGEMFTKITYEGYDIVTTAKVFHFIASAIEDYCESHHCSISMGNNELRKQRFCGYINDLCKSYQSNGRKLINMSQIREKYKITGLTKEQFFAANLHNATKFVNREFTDQLYDYILDRTKSHGTPIYTSK